LYCIFDLFDDVTSKCENLLLKRKGAFELSRGNLNTLISIFTRFLATRENRLLASTYPSARICVKFDIGDFYENLSRKSKFGYKPGEKLSDDLYDGRKYALLLPAKLHRHKSVLFERNGIRLL